MSYCILLVLNNLSYFHYQPLTLPSKKTSVLSLCCWNCKTYYFNQSLTNILNFLSLFPVILLYPNLKFNNPSQTQLSTDSILIPNHLNLVREKQKTMLTGLSFHSWVHLNRHLNTLDGPITLPGLLYFLVSKIIFLLFSPPIPIYSAGDLSP